jgi:4-hydroxybenzoate polyprenyltransferase
VPRRRENRQPSRQAGIQNPAGTLRNIADFATEVNAMSGRSSELGGEWLDEGFDRSAVADDASIRPPLAVDLDGTLILSNTLHESVVILAKSSPQKLIQSARLLPIGKAAVKRGISEETDLDPAMLPYNQEFLDYLRTQHASGRRIGLFTASDQSIADAVAMHLGLFDVVRGSDGVTNLSGEAKLAAIEAEFGSVFAYAGDSTVDLPIFAGATSAILVGPRVRRLVKLHAGPNVEAIFPLPGPTPLVWAGAFRLKHWVKNALVLVSPLLAGQYRSLLASLGLFVLMGMLASATYLLNDLTDLAADRAHPRKRYRPLACGAISVRDGLLAATVLIIGALIACLTLLPIGCAVVLICYLVITLLYSTSLKHVAMIDVTVLAGLFTLRVLAGGMLGAAPLSPWLLTFSMMFFLGLAAVKRYAELHRVVRTFGPNGGARGYSQQDMPILLATGVSTGVSSIVIFMIYLINEQYPQAAYKYPGALWGIMPLLLVWILRLWHLCVHGRMSEDPVLFAMRDRFSLALGGVVVLIMLVARL